LNSSIIEGRAIIASNFEIAFENRISPTKIEIFLKFSIIEKKKIKFVGFVFNHYFITIKIEKGPPLFWVVTSMGRRMGRRRELELGKTINLLSLMN
jgi:hypothetical protein